jgi:hypothetical protein
MLLLSISPTLDCFTSCISFRFQSSNFLTSYSFLRLLSFCVFFASTSSLLLHLLCFYIFFASIYPFLLHLLLFFIFYISSFYILFRLPSPLDLDLVSFISLFSILILFQHLTLSSTFGTRNFPIWDSISAKIPLYSLASDLSCQAKVNPRTTTTKHEIESCKRSVTT